jgi:diguanylate cyclase (GGDEF)-like protein/PAS domain S-box-containing protein/putative nucleotidyltransferase with HDIG domain
MVVGVSGTDVTRIRAITYRLIPSRYPPVDLFERVANPGEFETLYMGTPENHMINASGWIPPETFDLRTRPWYTNAIATDEVVVTDIFENATLDNQIFTIAQRITQNDGRLIGVVAGDISSETIHEIMEKYAVRGIRNSVVVNDSKEIQFILTDARREETSAEIDQIVEYLKNIELQETIQLNSIDGTDKGAFIAQQLIEGTSWHIITYIHIDNSAFLTSNMNRGFITIFIFALIVLISNALLINKSILKPILEIEQGIENINPEANASYRVVLSRKSDFGNLISKINELLSRIENYIFTIRQDRIKLNHMNAQLKKTLSESQDTEKELLNQKSNFEALFKNATNAIVQFDEEHRIVDINQGFTDLFGYELGEIELKNLDTLIVKETVREAAISYTKTIFSGNKITGEAFRVAKDGTKIEVLFKGIPISIDGNIVGGYAIYSDIRERKKTEREMIRQKAMFEDLFRNSTEAIVMIDKEQRVVDINENFTYLFGYKLDEVIGQYADDVITDDSQRQEAIKLTENLLSGVKVLQEGFRKGKNGVNREVTIKGVPIIYGNEIIGGYGIYSDISARKRAEKEVLYMSYHDQLTGLYNRRFFEEEFKRLDTKRNLPLALIMADVNGLKLFNDAFGHKLGDQLLRKTADIFRSICREDEIIARLGGDEFVILLPKTSVQEAEQIVTRMKEKGSESKIGNMELSISFGWDVKSDTDDYIDDLYKRVEDYMYRNKLVESPSVHGKMFETIIKTLHEKNPREEQHSKRVSELSAKFAKALGMNSREVEEIKTTGWLHDIGKVAISESILNKTGKLDNEEWTEIKRHPEIGYRILSTVNEMAELADIVLVHHERWDGKGYPQGLKGEEIPLNGRIIAVADAFDAMTRQRTYREVLSDEDAIEEIRKNAGTQFDPDIVEVFIEKVILAKE